MTFPLLWIVMQFSIFSSPKINFLYLIFLSKAKCVIELLMEVSILFEFNVFHNYDDIKYTIWRYALNEVIKWYLFNLPIDDTIRLLFYRPKIPITSTRHGCRVWGLEWVWKCQKFLFCSTKHTEHHKGGLEASESDLKSQMMGWWNSAVYYFLSEKIKLFSSSNHKLFWIIYFWQF